jgi:hypothetical protein
MKIEFQIANEEIGYHEAFWKRDNCEDLGKVTKTEKQFIKFMMA